MLKKFLYKAAGFTVLAGMNIFTSPAQAHDFSSPKAWRGEPLTTLQEWEFNSSPIGPLVPDGDLGWSDECDQISPTPGIALATPGPGIVSGTTGGDNYWGSSDDNQNITFDIPNCIDKEPMKLMHVQITIGNGQNVVGINNIEADDPTGPVDNTEPIMRRFINVGDPLAELAYDFYLAKWKHFPNPDSEKFDIVLAANTNVYQVVVDTYSVPEPITILGSATALGFGAFFKRKLKTSK